MKIEITKKRIKTAILEEPYFKAGSWVRDTRDRQVGDRKSCSVCAVGAVLRSVLDDKQPAEMIKKAAAKAAPRRFGIASIMDKISRHKILKSQIRNEQYMNALSTYFESIWFEADRRTDEMEISRHQVYRIRKKLVKFVDKNFPRKIVVDIDGAKPAKGMKVTQ